MDTSPRVLVVSTLTDEELCSSECERRNFVEASASIFLSKEAQYHQSCKNEVYKLHHDEDENLDQFYVKHPVLL
jgi:hypothetical protein